MAADNSNTQVHEVNNTAEEVLDSAIKGSETMKKEVHEVNNTAEEVLDSAIEGSETMKKEGIKIILKFPLFTLK